MVRTHKKIDLSKVMSKMTKTKKCEECAIIWRHTPSVAIIKKYCLVVIQIMSVCKLPSSTRTSLHHGFNLVCWKQLHYHITYRAVVSCESYQPVIVFSLIENVSERDKHITLVNLYMKDFCEPTLSIISDKQNIRGLIIKYVR